MGFSKRLALVQLILTVFASLIAGPILVSASPLKEHSGSAIIEQEQRRLDESASPKLSRVQQALMEALAEKTAKDSNGPKIKKRGYMVSES